MFEVMCMAGFLVLVDAKNPDQGKAVEAYSVTAITVTKHWTTVYTNGTQPFSVDPESIKGDSSLPALLDKLNECRLGADLPVDTN